MSEIRKILDGKALAALVQKEISQRVERGRARIGRPPGLGVILVGDNPASKTYVANKEKYAKKCGFETFDALLPNDATHAQVEEAIVGFNKKREVDGILLQLPLPKHLDSNKLLDLIDARKDADGLHPLNQGLLMRGAGDLRPCTPLGVMQLLDLALSPHQVTDAELTIEKIGRADLAGKRAVVIGRSILVGKAVALLLLERNATVMMAHSKTKDIQDLSASADIIVAAVGVPNLVKGSWVKQGAVVLDVGINRLPDGKLTGDVDFEQAASRASAITPVPGGVGPMTIAMLMKNTLLSYERSELR